MTTAASSQAVALVVERMRSRGANLLPATNTHTNRIQIRSESSSSLYTVSQRITNGPMYGRWECSCRGWVAHNKGRFDYRCKHLQTMVPLLENAAREVTRALPGRR